MRNGYRVIDVDSHVTPSLEVLHRYAGAAIKDRWDEFQPYVREMNSPDGRGHPKGPWHTLKVNPIPYNRIAGQKPGYEKAEKGGAGAVEGRVKNISTAVCHERIQHDNSNGRLEDMTLEGVDVNVLIPGTWAPASSAFEPALTTGLYDAYHTYMRDFCSADTDRLKGLFLAPGKDVAWAVRELERIGEEPWLCAVWPSLPEGMTIDDPDLEPLWQVMNDLHLPIMLSRHLGQRGGRAHGRASVGRTAFARVHHRGRHPRPLSQHQGRLLGDGPRLVAELAAPARQPGPLRQGRRAEARLSAQRIRQDGSHRGVHRGARRPPDDQGRLRHPRRYVPDVLIRLPASGVQLAEFGRQRPHVDAGARRGAHAAPPRHERRQLSADGDAHDAVKAKHRELRASDDVRDDRESARRGSRY
jgi:predicted TIM-barrel fold metal-dependent hydrolase